MKGSSKTVDDERYLKNQSQTWEAVFQLIIVGQMEVLEPESLKLNSVSSFKTK